MKDLRIPEFLMPQNVVSPAAFIAEKGPDLPDCGVESGDLVIVDLRANAVAGELSAYVDRNYHYRLSTEPVKGYSHYGKVVTVVKYFNNSPFLNDSALSDEPKTAEITPDKPLEAIGLSVRVFNALDRCGVKTLNQLAEMKPDDLLRTRNLGVIAYREIIDAMKQQGVDTSAFETIIKEGGKTQ